MGIADNPNRRSALRGVYVLLPLVICHIWYNICMKPYGYVYKITNKVNGKTYIGQRTLRLDKSWRQYMGSGKMVIAAISKHGKHNFVKSFLGYAWSVDELNSIEVSYMKSERAAGKAEYNLHIGSPAPRDSAWLMSDEDKTEVYNRIAEKTRQRTEKRYKEDIVPRVDEIVNTYKSLNSYEKTAKLLGLPKSLVRRALIENGIVLVLRTKKGYTQSTEHRQAISNSLKDRNINPWNYIGDGKRAICLSCGCDFVAKSFHQKNCSTKCRELAKRKRIRKDQERIPVSTDKTPKRKSQEIKRITPVSKNKPCEKCGEMDSATTRFCSVDCANKSRILGLDKEQLRSLYLDQGITPNTIGKMLGVSGQTVRNYLKKYGMMKPKK